MRKLFLIYVNLAFISWLSQTRIQASFNPPSVSFVTSEFIIWVTMNEEVSPFINIKSRTRETRGGFKWISKSESHSRLHSSGFNFVPLIQHFYEYLWPLTLETYQNCDSDTRCIVRSQIRALGDRERSVDIWRQIRTKTTYENQKIPELLFQNCHSDSDKGPWRQRKVPKYTNGKNHQ